MKPLSSSACAWPACRKNERRLITAPPAQLQHVEADTAVDEGHRAGIVHIKVVALQAEPAGDQSDLRRSLSILINRAAGGDRPELLDAVAADADIPVVEVDGRVAMAGDQADLVAEPEPVGVGRDGEPAVLVGGGGL